MDTQTQMTVLDNGNIRIDIPLVIKHKRGRKVIIAPQCLDGENADAEPLAQRALIKALVRAHAWIKAFEDGQFASVSQLAETLNLDRAYVGGILRIINLSPEIQQGILDGTEPDGLSINKLKCAIPSDWQEQKKAFLGKPI